jgi:hypothetical protein
LPLTAPATVQIDTEPPSAIRVLASV